jgi:hypothetical protein
MSLKASGDPEPVTEFGVTATDVNGSDLATVLSRDVSLGAPVKTAVGDSQNATTVWWHVKWGAQKAKVMLSYQVSGVSGAVINLIYHKAAASPTGNR